MTEQNAIISMTAEIVTAFVSHNPVRVPELPDLIASVHASLSNRLVPAAVEEPAAPLKPAVPVKKSITDDYLICLEDGKSFKSLRRHLATLDLTPAEYRTKWGLPVDYPMVAPGYARERSRLALSIGLGRKPKPAAVPMPMPAPPPEAAAAPPARRRGRPAKKAA